MSGTDEIRIYDVDIKRETSSDTKTSYRFSAIVLTVEFDISETRYASAAGRSYIRCTHIYDDTYSLSIENVSYLPEEVQQYMRVRTVLIHKLLNYNNIV